MVQMKNGHSRHQKGRVIRPYFNPETAPYGVFYVQGGKTGRVHLFVCLAFHSQAPELGMYACHWDGDSANNVPSNLRWATAKENQQDRLRHSTSGAGEAHPLAKITKTQRDQILADLDAGMKQQCVADKFGISQPQVSNIKSGKRWANA